MTPLDFGGWLEKAELVGGEVLYVHPRKDCIGRNCAVHNPSDHHMADWPQHFRADRTLTERICPHGIGHPDPDDLSFKRLIAGTEDAADCESVHGCDGCCVPKTSKENPVPTLTMTYGLPGSGKSTWAKNRVLAQVLNSDEGHVVRINKDDLRAMLHADQWSPTNERQVVAARDAMISRFLDRGVSVIVDDTNLAPVHEKRLRELARKHGAIFRVKDFSDVPVKTCIERDLQREKSVGKDVIEKMHRQYFAAPQAEPPAWVPGAPEAAVVDIDGTLARMVARGPFQWDRVESDEPIKAVVDSVRDLYWGSHVEIIFMSGRDEVCREATRRWLAKHLGEWTADLSLFMRPEGDMRKDSIVKEEIYHREIEGKYNVRAVYDDRDQVVAMWRSLGLTCFQVAPGNF